MRMPDVKNNFDGIKVACVGDSLTYGTTLLNRRVECYPSRLARLLGAKYDVLNFGFPGYAINKRSDRSLLNTPILKILENYAPNYILFLAGTNDARLKNYSSDDDFALNYKYFISALASLPSAPKVIAMTCPMAFTDANTVDFSQDILSRLVKIQKAIFNNNNIAYVDLYSLTQGKSLLYSKDMLHFNTKGAKFLAYKMYSVITEYQKTVNENI